MDNMTNHGTGWVRLQFTVPSRGLIGFRTALLSATRGTGIASSISAGYAPWAGQIVTRQNGSMVCDRQGVATPYAMQRLQARGNFFVEPQSPVYEGQVVGINNKPDELDVNITLAKHMTNMRSATADVLDAHPADQDEPGGVAWTSQTRMSAWRSRPNPSACARSS
jgi:TypA_BipA: GTP-binding protein TypA/BipA